ncbi:MAG: hypothetical protein ABI843_09130 [Dokdonella sp.]
MLAAIAPKSGASDRRPSANSVATAIATSASASAGRFNLRTIPANRLPDIGIPALVALQYRDGRLMACGDGVDYPADAKDFCYAH